MPKVERARVCGRPRGSTLGYHKERAKCATCNGTGLLAVVTKNHHPPVCMHCLGRGYTMNWIRHARAQEPA